MARLFVILYFLFIWPVAKVFSLSKWLLGFIFKTLTWLPRKTFGFFSTTKETKRVRIVFEDHEVVSQRRGKVFKNPEAELLDWYHYRQGIHDDEPREPREIIADFLPEGKIPKERGLPSFGFPPSWSPSSDFKLVPTVVEVLEWSKEPHGKWVRNTFMAGGRPSIYGKKIMLVQNTPEDKKEKDLKDKPDNLFRNSCPTY